MCLFLSPHIVVCQPNMKSESIFQTLLIISIFIQIQTRNEITPLYVQRSLFFLWQNPPYGICLNPNLLFYCSFYQSFSVLVVFVFALLAFTFSCTFFSSLLIAFSTLSIRCLLALGFFGVFLSFLFCLCMVS